MAEFFVAPFGVFGENAESNLLVRFGRMMHNDPLLWSCKMMKVMVCKYHQFLMFKIETLHTLNELMKKVLKIFKYTQLDTP